MITQAELKLQLHYNPDTGIFTRTKKTNRNVRIGDIAGGICHNYISISINNKKILAHRLAILYMEGYLPPEVTDHINGNGYDNRYCNLRVCTQSQNLQNKAKNKTNKNSIGIRYEADRKKWLARICVNYKTKNLGRFDTKEEAINAYKNAKLNLHSFNPVNRIME